MIIAPTSSYSESLVYQKILVFVEVKSRTNLNFGYPMEFVDRRKQDKIIKTAQIYIESKKFENIQCRFDVCEVYCFSAGLSSVFSLASVLFYHV